MQENHSAKTPRLGWRRARFVAGTLALTMGAFGTAALVTALPASATTNVSANFTIGSPSASVTGITISASPTTVGVASNYTLSFTSPLAIASGTNAALITVSAAVAQDAITSIVNSSGGATLYDITSGWVEALTPSATTLGTEVFSVGASGKAVAAGDQLRVLFAAVNPAAVGSYTYDVNTSANVTPALSNALAITAAPAGGPAFTVAASSTKLGDNSTFTMTNGTVAGLATAGTTASLYLVSGSSATADLAVWTSNLDAYSVVDATSKATLTATAVTVTSTCPSGVGTTDCSTAELTLSGNVTEGDALTVVGTALNTTTNLSSDTFYWVPEPGTGTVQGPSNAIVFGASAATSVTSVVASPASNVAGAATTYTVSFVVTTASPTTITFTEATDATNFTTETGWIVWDNTKNEFTSGNTFTAPGEITPGLAVLPAKGDAITVIVTGITNPAAAATVADFTVATSTDTAAADAAAYGIVAASTTSVTSSITVVPNPDTKGSLAVWTITGLQAPSAISASGTVTITGTCGTCTGLVFPSLASDYVITDATTATGSGTATAVAVTTNDIAQITVPNAIKAGDDISIVVSNVVNPSVDSLTDSLSFTNLDAAATTEAVFPDANVTYPDGSIVNFSGTYYVFAGGHAFGIPTPAVFAAIQAVDHAALVTAATGASVPTAAPRVGTLIVVYNNATIYVVGTDGDLHGFATPTQFVAAGYDGAIEITVPSLGGLTVGATVGSLGDAANALATSSDGAIVDSSGTYYVFAGGKAFGIPTPASLTTVLAGEPSGTTPLTGTVAASATTAAIAAGVVVTIGGGVYVTSGGTLFQFKSQSQLATDGYGGTPSITLPSVGGLTVSFPYSGS